MLPFRSSAIYALLASSTFLEFSTAASGTFDVLTYNVAGLPAILNPNGATDKVANARAIGSLLAAGAYDVAQLQEVCSIQPVREGSQLTRTGFQLPCIHLRD